MVIAGTERDDDKAVWKEIKPLVEERGIPSKHYAALREELSRVPKTERFKTFAELVDLLNSRLRQRLGITEPWPARRPARPRQGGSLFSSFMRGLTLILMAQATLGAVPGAQAVPVRPRFRDEDSAIPMPPPSWVPPVDAQAPAGQAPDTCLIPQFGQPEMCSTSGPYRPPDDAETWQNQGWWKDLFTSYPDDPQVKGAVFLKPGDYLVDGYYAYAYRESDGRIAVYYTGTSSNTNNAVPHSVLASGGKVYAAGMLLADGGMVVAVDTASGHYQPTPRIAMDKNTCKERVEPGQSLQYMTNKLVEMGLARPTVKQQEFRHPERDQQIMDCLAARTQEQGGLIWHPPK